MTAGLPVSRLGGECWDNTSGLMGAGFNNVDLDSCVSAGSGLSVIEDCCWSWLLSDFARLIDSRFVFLFLAGA